MKDWLSVNIVTSGKTINLIVFLLQIHISTQSKPSRILKVYASSGTLVKEGIT